MAELQFTQKLNTETEPITDKTIFENDTNIVVHIINEYIYGLRSGLRQDLCYCNYVKLLIHGHGQRDQPIAFLTLFTSCLAAYVRS